MQKEEVKTLYKFDFQSLDKGTSDAVTLSNQRIVGGLDELDKNVLKLDGDVKKRTTIGKILKVIVVLCGVIIATGFLTDGNVLVQLIGGFIALITAGERIFGNVDVLLTKVAARDAYRRIRRQIVNKHEAKIIDIVQIRDTTPKEAAKQYIKVQSEISDQIYKVDDEIKTDVENKRYEQLGRLSLYGKKD